MEKLDKINFHKREKSKNKFYICVEKPSITFKIEYNDGKYQHKLE